MSRSALSPSAAVIFFIELAVGTHKIEKYNQNAIRRWYLGVLRRSVAAVLAPTVYTVSRLPALYIIQKIIIKIMIFWMMILMMILIHPKNHHKKSSYITWKSLNFGAIFHQNPSRSSRCIRNQTSGPRFSCFSGSKVFLYGRTQLSDQ